MASETKTVLLVDDDPDVLDTMRLILERGGYKVATATSAEQGLRTYDASRPDLVIVDLMMEEVDAGTSFVKELGLRHNEAPVYLLSSVGDALSITADYRALGLAGVLQKPVDPEQLLALLRAQLG